MEKRVGKAKILPSPYRYGFVLRVEWMSGMPTALGCPEDSIAKVRELEQTIRFEATTAQDGCILWEATLSAKQLYRLSLDKAIRSIEPLDRTTDVATRADATPRRSLRVVLTRNARLPGQLGLRPVFRYAEAGLHGFAAYVGPEQERRLRRLVGRTNVLPSPYPYGFVLDPAWCGGSPNAFGCPIASINKVKELEALYAFDAKPGQEYCASWYADLTARQLFFISVNPAVRRILPFSC